MKKDLVLVSQKAKIFELISDLQLNPRDFEWVEVESIYTRATIVSQLIHRPSNFYYIFDFKPTGDYWAEYSPGKERTIEQILLGSWANQISRTKLWLTYLKREVETFDPWAAIKQETEIINATSADNSNALFTKNEKDYILSGINEIKQYLLVAHNLDPELVESRLNYLAEASNRVGRKDWINLLLSVLVGIVIAAYLPPETTREIFRFVGTILQNILRQPLLLP